MSLMEGLLWHSVPVHQGYNATLIIHCQVSHATEHLGKETGHLNQLLVPWILTMSSAHSQVHKPT